MAKDASIRLGALLEAFGPEAAIAPGATLEHAVAFEGGAAQLVATSRKDGRLDVRLARASELLWEGEMDVADVGRWSSFALKLPPACTPRASRQSAPAAPAERRAWSEREEQLARGLLPPAVGEIWIMDVRVEDDAGDEVRYRSINIGGEEYGAARVLPKAAFEEVFVASANGYRMLVRMLEVGEHEVVYQRLTAQRTLAGRPRSCHMIVFLANFIPEAGAY